MRTVRKRSSLVDDTAAELRHMIVAGQLQPGELLPPQRELAVRFGVGASTLREAVQTLIAVGCCNRIRARARGCVRIPAPA